MALLYALNSRALLCVALVGSSVFAYRHNFNLVEDSLASENATDPARTRRNSLTIAANGNGRSNLNKPNQNAWRLKCSEGSRVCTPSEECYCDDFEVKKKFEGKRGECWFCHKPLEWNHCASIPRHARIQKVSEYAFGLNSIVTHTVAVVYLSTRDTRESYARQSSGVTIMLELGGRQIGHDAHAVIYCEILSDEHAFSENDTKTAVINFSTLGQRGKKYKLEDNVWIQHATQPIKSRNFAGYAPQGYDDSKEFPATFQGLRQWSRAYVASFPVYDPLETNCQKFSIGVYNAMTKETNLEYQHYMALAAKAALPVVNNIVVGSAEAFKASSNFSKSSSA